MSLGAAIAAIFAFFALGYHGIGLDWWGNCKYTSFTHVNSHSRQW
jgi:hypothetical protein